MVSSSQFPYFALHRRVHPLPKAIDCCKKNREGSKKKKKERKVFLTSYCRKVAWCRLYMTRTCGGMEEMDCFEKRSFLNISSPLKVIRKNKIKQKKTWRPHTHAPYSTIATKEGQYLVDQSTTEPMPFGFTDDGDRLLLTHTNSWVGWRKTPKPTRSFNIRSIPIYSNLDFFFYFRGVQMLASATITWACRQSIEGTRQRSSQRHRFLEGGLFHAEREEDNTKTQAYQVDHPLFPPNLIGPCITHQLPSLGVINVNSI